MRILLINNSHSIKGGADRVYFNTGKLMEEHNHEVQYFSTIDQENEPTEFSKYFVKVSNKRESCFVTKLAGVKDYIYNKKAYLNLCTLIEEKKPDIAHIHLFCGGLSSSILKALKKYNIPIVQTVHDYRLLCPANAFLDSEDRICEKCINKSYYQCSVNRCVDGNFFFSTMPALEAYFRKYLINPLDFIDHFIFVSKFSQQKHEEFDQKYKSKSSHLYNFTTIPKTNPSPIKREYFLYFGRLSKEKGLTTLLNAALQTGIRLKIVGSGPMFNELYSLTRENSNIEILSHQSGEILANTITHASFIIVPSEWYENNPMTVLEAYSAGKPVIGSRIGGIPEIIEDGKTGFLYESRNTEELMNVIKKAQQLSESDYVKVSNNAFYFGLNNFAPGLHYKKLMLIYSQMLLNVQ